MHPCLNITSSIYNFLSCLCKALWFVIIFTCNFLCKPRWLQQNINTRSREIISRQQHEHWFTFPSKSWILVSNLLRPMRNQMKARDKIRTPTLYPGTQIQNLNSSPSRPINVPTCAIYNFPSACCKSYQNHKSWLPLSNLCFTFR